MKLHIRIATALLSIAAIAANGATIPTDLEHLYLVGEASPAGWNLDQAPELSVHDDVLSWTGYLGLGQFKLTTSRNNFNAIVSAEYDNYGVVVGTPMAAQFNAESGECDWKWYNNEPGYYILAFNPSDNTLTVSPVRLYLVGDASPAGWGRDAEMTLGDDGRYTWSGALDAGAFKLLYTTYNFDSFVSADEANCNVMTGVPMSLRGIAETDSDNDWKWVNTMAANYDITVDLSAMTIKVEPTALYLVGDATSGGWTLEDATEMTRQENGEYTWHGTLKGGSIKVTLSKDNWNSLVSSEWDNRDVCLNKPMPYKFCAQGDDNNDWKWNNTMTEEYTVKVNIIEHTFTVILDLDEIYLVGDAPTTGWNRGDAPLKKAKDGSYVWSGYLGNGPFKFVVSKTSPYWESIVPADCDGYGVVIGKPMTFAFNSGNDWKWQAQEGIYTLKMRLEDNSLTVCPYMTSLYLIGEATSAGWNRGEAPEIARNKDGKYVWEGHLEPGTFKFLVDRERWDSFGSAAASNPNVGNNTPMSLKYNKDSDIQWNITAAGEYRITVDLEASTMTAARLTELYLIGEATTAGWNRDDAPTMTSVDNNVFVWNGPLGTGQFKLLKSRDSWDSYVSSACDNYSVTPGQAMAMRDDGDDWKWYNNYPGDYTITANLSAGTLTVTPDTDGLIDPENQGHTTSQWPLEMVADNLYRYCGNLSAGRYHVVFSDGNALKSNNASGFEKTRNRGAATEFLVASDTDRMQVFVHLGAGHVTFDTYAQAEDLYAVGDFNDWTLSDEYRFNNNGDDSFEWNGTISTDKGSGFMIAAVTADSRFNVMPYFTNEALSEYGHFMTSNPTASEPAEAPARVKGAPANDDAAWALSSSGNYSFMVNMYNRELSATHSNTTPTATDLSMVDPSLKAYGHGGMLYVETSKAAEVAVYDISGHCVARVFCDVTYSMSLPRGIYIVAAAGEVVKIAM